MSYKNIKLFCYVAVGIYCILTLVSGQVVYVVAYIFMMLLLNYLRIRREKDIEKMWQLSDELNLSLDKLSEISGMGVLDLQATKYDEPGRYLPPRQTVKNTIRKLEEMNSSLAIEQ